MQVDNWLNQRPFDGPEKAPQAQGPVIVIGAGPAGLAAANHLKVSKQQLRFSGVCFLLRRPKEGLYDWTILLYRFLQLTLVAERHRHVQHVSMETILARSAACYVQIPTIPVVHCQCLPVVS